MMEVALAWYEVQMAADVGVRRNVEALSKNRKGTFEGGKSTWESHILGACGEMAFAKAFGLYWEAGVNTFKAGGDVCAVEVRTRAQHDWELIVRDDDPDGRIYFLVTGGPEKFRLHGWIKSEDARRPEWRQNHGGYKPAYFVPHSALKSLDQLVAL
jgi:hypothetical protein